jgi:hypothetical protein
VIGALLLFVFLCARHNRGDSAMRVYSDESRADDKWSLPDVEVFELTADEVATRDEDMVSEYMRRHEYRLASMSGQVRERMIDAMTEENGITGGWFYWYCLPGCMPDSDAIGPYESAAAAIAAMRGEN